MILNAGAKNISIKELVGIFLAQDIVSQ